MPLKKLSRGRGSSCIGCQPANPALGTAALGGFMLLSAVFVVLLGDPEKKKTKVTAAQE